MPLMHLHFNFVIICVYMPVIHLHVCNSNTICLQKPTVKRSDISSDITLGGLV